VPNLKLNDAEVGIGTYFNDVGTYINSRYLVPTYIITTLN
jgi:hypothetical protein